MNIGEFKMVRGQLLGSVATVSIDLPRLGLNPTESENDRAPRFEIMAFNGKRWVQIGALWEATSNASGEVFYQGRLDDPSMAEPLPVMLFGDETDGYRVVWNRPTPRRENFDGTRQNRRPRRDDDFGNGNVGNDGRMMADERELAEDFTM
ncbi:DUF736 domain-containing protein [Sphingomonas sp. Leaf4]|uniref:DUF736 domain-containing protein n=1 Tax=Sphingomonas sp. Leaf4 TaxID=2876553 RepID=UPI001E32197D|nr:DUF736 domain-containing protein [Sphingomonas sp. Leaf4]